MSKLEALLTIKDIMQLVPGLSERTLRSDLRFSKQAYEIHGKLYVSAEQFKQWLESKKLCRSESTKGAKPGIATALSPEGAYEEALRLTTSNMQNVLQQKSKAEKNVRRSMAKRKNTPSPNQPSNTSEKVVKRAS